jgi:hypothetical protein
MFFETTKFFLQFFSKFFCVNTTNSPFPTLSPACRRMS